MKPGYKQTEVGVIPEDWDVKPFTQVTDLITCGIAATPDYVSESQGYPFLSSTNVKEGRIVWSGYKHISADLHHQLFRNNPPKRGDILYSRVGTFGEAGVVDVDFEFSVYVSLTLIKPGKALDSCYLMQLLNSNAYKQRAKDQIYLGGGVGNLNVDVVRRYPIVVPPLPEQRAIATALSDVDGLLGGLDRLIAKKRDLKQAAMQQLLTGQTRLPGFHAEWEMKRLDALADIRSGGTPSTGESRFWDGDIPWCTPTDITALNGHKYLGETARMITQLGLKASSAEMIPAHSVVMTSRATIGECAINAVPVSTNQGFKNFVPFATTDVDFLYYLLATQKQGFISLCGGSTFLEIGKTQLIAYQVRLPATKAEQTAIASVLTEMDAELAVLEQRREKTRALKQAMMQELLTGRTRLL
jgi:type I restriction enzyme S subunit